MDSLGWPAWLLLALLALSGLLSLALHLFRFRYDLSYDFPSAAEARMEIAFLGWSKVLASAGGRNTDVTSAGGAAAAAGAGEADDADAGGFADPSPDAPAGRGPSGSGSPRPGQDGFLAIPGKRVLARLRGRFKSAGLKWVLDLPVWGHLAAYLLGSGARALRLLGPSLDHLHVGSSDVYNLGRFAAAWSSLRAALPFLACPVEYAFNERPFAFRLRLSGGCTALGFLAFVLALFVTLPWRRLAARFLSCWRNPRLALWQSRLVAAAA